MTSILKKRIDLILENSVARARIWGSSLLQKPHLGNDKKERPAFLTPCA